MAYSKSWDDVYHLPNRTTQDGNILWNSVGKVTLPSYRAGSKMPDWKQKIRDGSNATTAFVSIRGQVYDVSPGYIFDVVKYQGSTYLQRFDGTMTTLLSNSPEHLIGPSSKAKSIALSKLYKKIKSEQEHLNSLAVIAEGLDVIRQFGAPCESIIDLTNRHLNRLELERRGLRGSTVFKRIRWLEIVAATYLEYSFGLKPLIADTRAVAEALARWQYEISDNPDLRARVSSRASEESSHASSSSDVQVPSMSFARVNVARKKVTESRCQYVAGLKAEPSAAFGSNDRLLSLLGYDPSNWVPAIWEAIPWSWLFDYFTNIQQILEAGVTNTSGVRWISETVSQRSETHYTWSPLAKPDIPVWQMHVASRQAKGGQYKVRQTSVSRTSPPGLEPPPLYFEHPFESAQKIANLAAVLFSRRKGQSALWLF